MRNPRSITPHCFATAWLVILASFATSPGLSHAQSTGPNSPKTPTRLPSISPQLLEQLPPGCTSSWEGLEPLDHAAEQNAAVPAPPAGGAHLSPYQARQADSTHQLLRKAAMWRNAASADADSLLDDGLLGEPSTGDDEESLLSGDSAEDDPLSGLGPTKKIRAPANDNGAAAGNGAGNDAGHPLDALYPSAQTCAKCHPKHYDEWRVSNHAYSTISPMFQRFEQAMQELTQGTVGQFCFRCHSPVATQLSISSSATILDAPPIVREGITCVTCHRVKEAVGRTHGDRRIEPGDIHAPIYGSSPGDGVREARAKASELKLKLSPDEKGPGQPMHQHCGPFEPISKSDYCASCHQVAVHPGIWLEIVHAQYRSGPAHAKGITCQDCHMGKQPGKADGYEYMHCAEISGKPFGIPRKHSNHTFWGPGYSIAHPGIFPHNPDANKYTPRQWLSFEYRSGWGTKEFEDSVPPGQCFPPPWDNKDERIAGRKIIDANFRKIDEKRGSSTLALAAGVQVDGPHIEGRPTVFSPLHFSYCVTNVSEGHNVPTGSLGAQPQMWLNVALINPAGVRIWESGYLDRNGDLADLQSVDVNNHRMRRDAQLFNLQTKFLINNIRGTDREAPAPLNYSLDQLIFLRPGAVPVSVLNHPPLIRMEAHSIPPLDHRKAKYVIPAELMQMPGLYRLSVRMRSRPEPPYFMRLVGASPEMIRRLNENIIDFEHDSHTFEVETTSQMAMPKSLPIR